SEPTPEQLPDRELGRARLDVPQRDVDRADGCAQHGSLEWTHAVEVVPVALDLERVTAEEIAAERLDDGVDRGRVRPARGLPEAGQTRVGTHEDPVQVAGDVGLDGFDLHERLPEVDVAATVPGAGPPSQEPPST